MWRLPDDQSKPIITAAEQIESAHLLSPMELPETAIVFFMRKGPVYLTQDYDTVELPESFPCFLNRRPIWRMRDLPICFLYGGSGAPQAADTLETLAALGVKKIVAAGMFGAFSELVHPGDIVLPERCFVEEGTSLHYYSAIDAAAPDRDLHQRLAMYLQKPVYPIVSVDAVYRQTFRKEALWREKGAVGVDMETSAVFSISRYLGLRAAALLIASDVHPLAPDAPKWEWVMSGDMRHTLAEQSVLAAKALLV